MSEILSRVTSRGRGDWNFSALDVQPASVQPASSATRGKANAYCKRVVLKGVADGFGGPSVAHTTSPSRIDAAANRKENPLMS
jgi:hypothetical protein